LGVSYDKPGITYDPVKNRVYVTWTNFKFKSLSACSVASEQPQLRYYDVGKGTWSPVYTAAISGDGTGTAPVTSGGKLYVFYENTSSPVSIQYFTFNNGSVSASKTVEDVVPVGNNNDSACQPALDTQAWDQGHAALAHEFPTAAVDSQGNIDVTWNGAPPPGEGTGPSVIYVATLPHSGGKPYVQALPDNVDSTGQLLIQWQPSIAYAGGSNGLAVGYFQVIQLPDGSYQIERDQVTASASATPNFGPAAMISTVSWNPPPNNTSGARPCYEGDYSDSASTPTANVVWSYWGDSRNTDPNGAPEQDIYGLYTSVP